MLAYAVGFGGSMIWFGSSAGVALSNMYPEAKNVGRWLYHGWHIAVAYVIGFFVMLALLGWHPTPKRGDPPAAPPAVQQPCTCRADRQHIRSRGNFMEPMQWLTLIVFALTILAVITNVDRQPRSPR